MPCYLLCDLFRFASFRVCGLHEAMRHRVGSLSHLFVKMDGDGHPQVLGRGFIPGLLFGNGVTLGGW